MKRRATRPAANAKSRLDATERQAKMLLVLLCVGLSAGAVLPFFFMGDSGSSRGLGLQMPDTHDMQLHLAQMKSFHEGLKAGEVYPRWEEDTNRGFGAPTTSYYPPGIYYLTSACYAIAGDWWRAILDAHLLMMIASAAALYLYARRVMNRGAAAIAMATYVWLPYHLTDQYQRGAIAELLGFVWMPLMLFLADRLFTDRRNAPAKDSTEKGDRRLGPARFIPTSGEVLNASGLAACYGAFLWSHPPTAYQFSMAFGLFLVGSAIVRRDGRGLVLSGMALAFGLALSAAYLYPAAAEQDLIRHEYISTNFPYHNTYVFVHKLPYADASHPFFRMIDMIWLTGTIAIAVCGVFLLPRSAGLPERARRQVGLWVLMGCFAAFMMTEASYPIGRFIPKIDIGVFTWRMLAIETLVLALLAGACFEAATMAAGDRLKRKRVGYRALAIVLMVGGAGFSLGRVIGPLYNAPIFVPLPEHLNYATIPRTAPDEPLDLPEVDRAEMAGDKGTVAVQSWLPEHRTLSIGLNAPEDLLVRTFNFPGWTAHVDGTPAPIVTGEPLGDIVLELKPGTHTVQLDFLNTPVRRFGDRVTIFSTVLLILAAGGGLLLRRRSSRAA